MTKTIAFLILVILSPILLFLFLLHWIDENVHALANTALTTIQGELPTITQEQSHDISRIHSESRC